MLGKAFQHSVRLWSQGGGFGSLQKTKKMHFPGSPVVETALPMPGAQVRSLIRELRSDTSQDMALKEIAKKEKKFNFTR